MSASDNPFSKNDLLKMKILANESAQARTLREAVLGDPAALARLRAIDNVIAALREQLTQE